MLIMWPLIQWRVVVSKSIPGAVKIISHNIDKIQSFGDSVNKMDQIFKKLYATYFPQNFLYKNAINSTKAFVSLLFVLLYLKKFNMKYKY